MESKTLTIMFTDMKDFTRRTHAQSREENLILLERHESIIRPIVINFKGRIIKNLGDSFLVIFESPTNALLCAIEIQKKLAEHNKKTTDADKRIELRIGLNAGEVNLSESDVMGNPVNIAARVVSITEVNRIFFTEAVYLTMNKSEIGYEYFGEKVLKGIQEPVKFYTVVEKNQSDAVNLAQSGEEVSAHSFLASNEDAKFDEYKIDPAQLENVFDFTNINVEKKFDEESIAIDEKVRSSGISGTLELDSSPSEFAQGVKGPEQLKEGKKQRQLPQDEIVNHGIEHSKELLTAIRKEKHQTRLAAKLIIGGLIALFISAYFFYDYHTKLEEKRSREGLQKQLDESLVLQALKPTVSVAPTPEIRFKAIETIEYGVLSVKSYPLKAEIYLDGTKLKILTPAMIKKVTPDKTHRLVIRKNGYKPFEVLFDLTSGETKEIEANLER